MNVIQNKKIYLTIAGLLMALAVILMVVYPLNLGIDFTGGALLEVEVVSSENTPVGAESLEGALQSLALSESSVRGSGEGRFVIKTAPLTETEHQQVITALSTLGSVQELRFTSIGPTIGAELRQSGIYAIIAVVLLIIAYIAFVFRKVSKPVQSWKYGVVAIVALMHDLLIPLGVFAVLGAFYGVVIDSLFITALLAILGLSVNDTIVVFDRIRENLERSPRGDFAETVERSISETFIRSINTSVTTILVLLALFFVGPESTQYFVLALLIGMIAGTYSSIFVASPLLVLWQGNQNSRRR